MDSGPRRSPVTRGDRDRLARWRGLRLVGVTYHYLQPAWGPDYSGGESGVDGDLMSVRLELEGRGISTVSWGMPGLREGMTVYDGVSPIPESHGLLDASNRKVWADHLGQPLLSLAGSWQRAENAEDEETLWSFRLDFKVGSVVLALGTYSPLEYIPNELVVLGDAATARSYSPPHASGNAWGTPL